MRMNYLQHTELEILRQNTAKSWNKSSKDTLSDLLTHKQNYVLKSPHEGKSKNMLFGKETSLKDWNNYLSTKKHYIIQ